MKSVIEKPSIWKCPWCHKENIRQNAGGDRCFVCGAIVFTEFTGYENEIRVRHSQRPRRESEHLDCEGVQLQQPSPAPTLDPYSYTNAELERSVFGKQAADHPTLHFGFGSSTPIPDEAAVMERGRTNSTTTHKL